MENIIKLGITYDSRWGLMLIDCETGEVLGEGKEEINNYFECLYLLKNNFLLKLL